MVAGQLTEFIKETGLPAPEPGGVLSGDRPGQAEGRGHQGAAGKGVVTAGQVGGGQTGEHVATADVDGQHARPGWVGEDLLAVRHDVGGPSEEDAGVVGVGAALGHHDRVVLVIPGVDPVPADGETGQGRDFAGVAPNDGEVVVGQ